MTRKSQLLITVMALGIFDAVILFFPILAILSIYILLAKPPWFLDYVQELYKEE